MPGQAEIRRVLLTAWDPLSVGDNPNLGDEYDEFIGKLMEQLSGQPSVDDIELSLRNFEGRLGTHLADGTSRQRAAAELVSL